MTKLNKTDIVYYVECHFGCVKHNILHTTVGEAIDDFGYSYKEVLEEFSKQESQNYFILNSVHVSGYLRNYRFYFDRKDAVQELLKYIDSDISRVKKDLKALVLKRKEFENG